MFLKLFHSDYEIAINSSILQASRRSNLFIFQRRLIIELRPNWSLNGLNHGALLKARGVHRTQGCVSVWTWLVIHKWSLGMWPITSTLRQRLFKLKFSLGECFSSDFQNFPFYSVILLIAILLIFISLPEDIHSSNKYLLPGARHSFYILL